MKTNTTPHDYRRQFVHSIFLIMLAFMALIAASCSPQRRGCRATKGMGGYGWLKCRETNKVCILDKDGAILCAYIDNK